MPAANPTTNSDAAITNNEREGKEKEANVETEENSEETRGFDVWFGQFGKSIVNVHYFEFQGHYANIFQIFVHQNLQCFCVSGRSSITH